ncbi:guanylate-binding protein 1 isoform X2 [Hyalella azteca]|nr:guanylate-binding protein 1 isoform X2 [Hyalella azteca]
MDGRPVPIVVRNHENRKFELDEAALRDVLLSPEVGDKPVCVVAVAGAYRKGKSFLLNFLVKFCINKGLPNWLGDLSQPLEGFVWSGSIKGQTTGIEIWSKPFFFTKRTGEEVAVILMDTQGTFDTDTPQDSTFIFALTLLASSVTVYNIMNNIQEDDLMNLQMFSAYGALAQQNDQSSRAFQKLLFLVRDWSFAQEYPYGHENGQRVLEEKLKVKQGQDDPVRQRLRDGLRQSFEELECYLMPHIGLKFNDSSFDGRRNQLDERFVEHLQLLVPHLLAPERLVVKRSAVRRGQPATGEEVVELIKTYMAAFQEKNLIEPVNLVELMSRVCSEGACKIALAAYKKAMDSIICLEGKNDTASTLLDNHFAAKDEAIAVYVRENKYAKNKGLFPVADEIKQLLEAQIDELFRREVEARSCSEAAYKKAFEAYQHDMDEMNCPGGEFLDASVLMNSFITAKNKAIRIYDQENKYADSSENFPVVNETRARLEMVMESMYSDHMEANERKQKASQCSSAAKMEALSVYKSAMDLVIGTDKALDTSTLMEHHSTSKANATQAYAMENQYTKDSELFPVVNEIKAQLESEIEGLFSDYSEKNQVKLRQCSLAAKEKALKAYEESMDLLIRSHTEVLDASTLKKLHLISKIKATQAFDKKNQCAQRSELSHVVKEIRAQLEREIEEKMSVYMKTNEARLHTNFIRVKSFSAKVLVLGAKGVGKTCLINRYSSDNFSPQKLKAGVEFTSVTTRAGGYDVKFQLLDTAGQEAFRNMPPQLYRGARAAIIVYAVSDADSFKSVKTRIEELQDKLNNKLVMVLVGNKLDLVGSAAPGTSQAVSAKDAAKLARVFNASFIECSALTNEGVNEAFDLIALGLAKEEKTNDILEAERLLTIKLSSKKDEEPKKSSCPC